MSFIRSADVFISYSSDDLSVASAACHALEADGVRCWMAPRNILPGRNYAAEIMRAIATSQVMIVVLSESSNTSPQVLREVERAVHRRLTVVTFRIEAVELSPELEYYVSAPHWLDALTRPLGPHLRELVITTRELLRGLPVASGERAETKTRLGFADTDAAADAEPRFAPAASTAGAARAGRKTNRRLILAAVAIVIVGLWWAWGAWVRRGPVSREIRSVAVLPFVNLSANNAQTEYLSDGLTEKLINALSQIEVLKVPARTSSFAFKDGKEDVRQIGRKLDVDAVVEGSWRLEGTTAHVSVQLISVEDGYHLWSKTYVRELGETFALQDEIVKAIVNALAIELGAIAA